MSSETIEKCHIKCYQFNWSNEEAQVESFMIGCHWRIEELYHQETLYNDW
jgi:hypothetical protein